MERLAIPEHGRPRADVLADIDRYCEGDVDYEHGRTWSLVYWAGSDHHDLVRDAHDKLLAGNALNPGAFKSLKRMEAEVVQMTASMLHAPETAVGTMTSGGTESLLCAVLAARERARSKWPWIRRPNLVLPETAHPAFDKAAHAFGITLRRAACDDDGRALPAKVKRAIDRNTVLVVASAPSYPWGVVDPIAEIAEIAAARGLPLHVDACFGGFVLPWLEALGIPLPVWDFRNPGVTSMSADVHKYGYAPKGASTIVYRDMDFLRHQFFVTTHWQGGVYASPTLAGSRPGGPIAGAWASLQGMGRDGFLDKAKGAWDAAEALRAGIRAIPGLRLFGLPHTTAVAYGSADPALDLFAVCDRMEAAGWAVDRQQRPATVHCTVNAANAPQIEPYLAALRRAVDEARADPSLATKGQAAVYGLLAAVPVQSITDRAVRDVLAGMYAPGVTGAPVDAGGERIEQAAAWVKRAGGWVDRLRGRR